MEQKWRNKVGKIGMRGILATGLLGMIPYGLMARENDSEAVRLQGYPSATVQVDRAASSPSVSPVDGYQAALHLVSSDSYDKPAIPFREEKEDAENSTNLSSEESAFALNDTEKKADSVVPPTAPEPVPQQEEAKPSEASEHVAKLILPSPVLPSSAALNVTSVPPVPPALSSDSFTLAEPAPPIGHQFQPLSAAGDESGTGADHQKNRKALKEDSTEKKADLSPAPSVPGEKKDSEAEADDKESAPTLESLRKSLVDLQGDLDKMKKDLGKKQNVADPNGKFTCKLGGMIFMDALMNSQSEASKANYGNVDNDFMFRDIRLSATGNGYGNLSYELTIGYNKGVRFKDVCLQATNTPVFGDLRVGYFKVESSMGYLASIFNESFADFDSNTYAFRLARRMGVGSTYLTDDKNGRLFLGVFTGKDLDMDQTDCNKGDSAGIVLNVRGSSALIYHETTEGRLDEVFHVGGSFYWDQPENDFVLRWRPTSWTYDSPYLMNGKLKTTDFSVTEAEVAWQKGQFAFQTEAFFGTYDNYDNSYGLNVQSRYFLTPGAYRTYDRNRGAFGGVYVPENLQFVDYENYRCFQGMGAWEIAGQWSWTDLTNLDFKPAAGDTSSYHYGRGNEFIGALNWYWNPQTVISAEWIHSVVDSAKPGEALRDSTCNTVLLQGRFRF